MLEQISNKTYFRVKCTNSKGTTTLTEGQKYTVIQIGFNGHYCMRGDTERLVWHKPERFKLLTQPSEGFVIIGSTPKNFLE